MFSTPRRASRECLLRCNKLPSRTLRYRIERLFTYTEIFKDDIEDVLDVVDAGDATEGDGGGFETLGEELQSGGAGVQGERRFERIDASGEVCSVATAGDGEG